MRVEVQISSGTSSSKDITSKTKTILSIFLLQSPTNFGFYNFPDFSDYLYDENDDIDSMEQTSVAEIFKQQLMSLKKFLKLNIYISSPAVLRGDTVRCECRNDPGDLLIHVFKHQSACSNNL